MPMTECDNADGSGLVIDCVKEKALIDFECTDRIVAVFVLRSYRAAVWKSFNESIAARALSHQRSATVGELWSLMR